MHHKFVWTYVPDSAPIWACKGCKLAVDSSLKPTRSLLKLRGLGLNCQEELVRKIMAS